MNIIGKTPINPILFYTGKISGYCTWVILLLSVLDIPVVAVHSAPAFKYTSYALFLTGLLLTLLSMINLGRSTRLGLPQEDTVFKTNGVYGLSRNPMYLGFDLLTLSAILYTLNIGVISLGIYSIVIYHFIILGEEKFLEQRFGNVYIDYRQKIRRYL